MFAAFMVAVSLVIAALSVAISRLWDRSRIVLGNGAFQQFLVNLVVVSVTLAVCLAGIYYLFTHVPFVFQ